MKKTQLIIATALVLLIYFVLIPYMNLADKKMLLEENYQLFSLITPIEVKGEYIGDGGFDGARVDYVIFDTTNETVITEELIKRNPNFKVFKEKIGKTLYSIDEVYYEETDELNHFLTSYLPFNSYVLGKDRHEVIILFSKSEKIGVYIFLKYFR